MFNRILKSKVFFIVLVIISIASAIELVIEVKKRQNIETLIRKQEATVESIEKENRDLSEIIRFYNSDSFVEAEARKKLNLSKPGESLIVLESTPSVASASSKEPNVQKWFNYFFSEK